MNTITQKLGFAGLALMLLLGSCKDEESMSSSILSKETDNSLLPAYSSEDHKYGYINHSGTFIIEPDFERSYNFSTNGIAMYYDSGEYGYIDKSGEKIISAQYRYADDFYEGLAAVREDYSSGYNYIDKEGDEVISGDFAEADFFSEGLAAVQDNYGEYIYFINKEGDEVIDGDFVELGFFWNGYAVMHEEQGNDEIVVIINRNGETVTELDEDYIDSDLLINEGLLAVKDNNHDWGYVNLEGEEVIRPKFDYAEFFLEGVAAVRNNNDWYFIDKKGEKVEMPYEFENIDFGFSEGMAAVKYNGKWGYINHSGNFVIQPQFSSVSPFLDGVAETNLGYINKSGVVFWSSSSPTVVKKAANIKEEARIKRRMHFHILNN